jgi:hypothetical protein
MGTSQSSKGPPGGVPMVPPWVPDAVPPATPPAEDGTAPPTDTPSPPDSAPEAPIPAEAPIDAAPTLVPMGPVPIAPAARFRGARRSLGSFARSGDAADMRRSLGRYVRGGYGGARTATRRFGGTASTAGGLYDALSSVATGQAVPGSALDPVLLSGRSARQVIDVIVEAVRPADGTQDAEASRAAIRDAMSDLLTKFVDADPVNLNPEQREFVIERFVAIDVYRRFVLDLGKTIQDKAPSAATGLSRLKQVRDYVKETISASFRKLREASQRISAGRVKQIVGTALRDTLEVFEGYAE